MRSPCDVIVIDEVHRAGAQSYQRIMEHFMPRLWFGMTASPDRPDGFDIYALFEHHIVYELRLQQALEESLLCPFHYFGLTELATADGEEIEFNQLVHPKRVEYILRQARFFGYSGSRVKGLIFCSRNDEAQALSLEFNRLGLRTVALSGQSSPEARTQAIERLERDDAVEPLDYILTVDIFNEGVDIPAVNQVILLRQTQSPIVFVQQLGRGLRRAPDKEFTVVLDFIGQYETNYMIPVALSGDRSYRRETLRRAVSTGNSLIAGESTISFDPVARERIYRSIDTAVTDSLRQLKKAYQLLRYKLGCRPKLTDFEVFGEIDATKIFARCESYQSFLRKVAPDDAPDLSERAAQMLAYLSQKIGSGQRPIEALALQAILDCHNGDVLERAAQLQQERFTLPAPERTLRSCRQILTNDFARTAEQARRTSACVFVAADSKGTWRASEAFAQELQDSAFVEQVQELVAFVLQRYDKVYAGGYRDTALKLYELYSYEDVCRMLDWQRNISGQNIGGYFYDKDTKTLPVFINYDKHDEAIAYEDRFISPTLFEAISKTKRRVESADADHIFKRTELDADNRIYLFVRKNNADPGAKAFYFLGEVQAVGEPRAIKVQSSDAFEVSYHLLDAVRGDIYQYLTH